MNNTKQKIITIMICALMVVTSVFTPTTIKDSVLGISLVTFDKKGNLVIKFKIANNGSGRINSFSDLKIAITASNKSQIATYKKTSFAVNLNSYKDKSYSITIPKSSLKKSQKNIDLRTAKIKITDANANSEL